MKKQIKKGIAIALVLVGALSLASCGKPANSDMTADGKTVITIGDWPMESRPEMVANFEKMKADFEAAYPQYVIKPDTYVFDVKTYVMKVTGKTVPDIVSIPFTEVTKVINNGYCADITGVLEGLGWMKYINPEIAKLVSKGEGLYAIPHTTYLRGFGINKKLFTEAGLVNDDGSIKTPKTWDEVAEYAKVIKEKTGKAGFVLPTTNNCGGWDFLNLAWSFGVDFMEEGKDGKYTATFDTKECRAAFQYIYDLKWKYNAFPDNTVISNAERDRLFGTYEGAMTYMMPPGGDCVQKYKTNKDDIIITGVPEGPAGKYTQIGGSVYVFAPDATTEQIKGCLEWMKFQGYGPRDMTEKELKTYDEALKTSIGEGALIMEKDEISLWTYEDSKKAEIRKKHSNVNMQNFEEYFKFAGTARPEEPVCCQELYSVIDGCIQKILTEEKVNIDELVTNACNDFQINYLDKL